MQEYALGVPKGVTSLTPTVAAALGDTVNVTYSPALDADGKVKISDLPDGKLTITVVRQKTPETPAPPISGRCWTPPMM